MSEAEVKQRLVAALRELGLCAGDSVIVHSSFRALRPVVSRPQTVMDALLEVLGPMGNLLLPTFNYSRPLPEPYYDPRTTPCHTGIIPELGRQRPEALRSLHPTHSVAVIGPAAHELTQDHLRGRAMGPGSPLDLLAQRGGKVLLIGVGHTSNSTIHVAEEHAGIPKPARWPAVKVKVRRPDGVLIEHELDSSPSCSRNFDAAEPCLRRRGVIRDARLGDCALQLMRQQDVIDVTVKELARQPELLLCDVATCARCPGTRAALARSAQ